MEAMADSAQPASAGLGSVAGTISNGVVQLFREYTGRGPTRARTVISRDAVMVVMSDTLTKAEHQLVAHGYEERVLRMRDDVQRIMRPELVKLVETKLERSVVAFMSSNHVDPDMAVEVFVLQPGDGDVPRDISEG
jgi:uncharacterized protein YbcI